MPPEWNTRRIVEVPEAFVCGLLHDSEFPTLLGSAAFSRATLSNSIWLSSAERPRLPLPRNGFTWACAAGRKSPTASATDKQSDDRTRIHVSSCTHKTCVCSSAPRRHELPYQQPDQHRFADKRSVIK